MNFLCATLGCNPCNSNIAEHLFTVNILKSYGGDRAAIFFWPIFNSKPCLVQPTRFHKLLGHTIQTTALVKDVNKIIDLT